MPRTTLLLLVVVLAWAAPALAVVVAGGQIALQRSGADLDGTVDLDPRTTLLGATSVNLQGSLGALDVHATLALDGAGGGTLDGTLTGAPGASAFAATTGGSVACDDDACTSGAIDLATDVAGATGTVGGHLPGGWLYAEDVHLVPGDGGALAGTWTLHAAPLVATRASPAGCSGAACNVTTFLTNGVFHDAARDADVSVGGFVRYPSVSAAGTTVLFPRTRVPGTVPPDYAFVDDGMFFDLRTTATYAGPLHVCIQPSFLPGDHPLKDRLVLARRSDGVFRPATVGWVQPSDPLGVCADVDGPGLLAVLIEPANLVTTTTVTTTTTSSTTPGAGGTTTTVTFPLGSTTSTTRPCGTVRCRLRAVVSQGACAGQRIPKRLARPLERAATLAERADRVDGTAQATRLRRRAGKLLDVAGRVAAALADGRRPRLTPDCAGTVRAVATGVREDIGT